VASRSLLDEQSKLIDPISKRVWNAILEPLDGEARFGALEPGKFYAQNPEACDLFRMLVYLKHGVTFRSLILDIEKNHNGYPKLIAVHRDYDRLLTGKKPLGGLRLKFNYDHFSLMVQGLDFGLEN